MNSEKKINKFNVGDTVNYDNEDIPYKIEKCEYRDKLNTYEYHIYDPGNITNNKWVSECNIVLASPQQTFYNTRDWLNSETSPSTGSIVCFDGITRYSDGLDTNCFIELSDCHQKARIHKSFSDTMDDWINKVEIVQNSINAYLTHLKTKYNK